MNSAHTILRVLSSKVSLIAAGLILVAAALFAADLPQGGSSRDLLAIWPLASGPYVVLLSLHHLARSPLVWSAILLAILHMVAVRLVKPTKPAKIGITNVVLAIVTMAAMVFLALDHKSPPVVENTRLMVHLDDGAHQVVDEGSAYLLPSSQGQRTLLFGTADIGPYAVESGSKLAIHLPLANGQAGDLAVSARRPVANDTPTPRTGPGLLPGLGTLIIGGLALWAIIATTRQQLLKPIPQRLGWLTGFVAVAVLVLANPWTTPGSGRFPVGEHVTGAPVIHHMIAKGALDVSSWNAWLPAFFNYHAVTIMAHIAALIGIVALALLLRDRVSGPSTIPAKTAALAGFTFFAIGLLLVGHALLRIPLPVDELELQTIFITQVLPRIRADVSVSYTSLSHGGPYSLPVLSGLVPALGYLVIGLSMASAALRASAKPKKALELRTILILLVLAGLARSALAFWFGNTTTAPAAAQTIALIASCLAVFGLFAYCDDAKAMPSWLAVTSAMLLVILVP